ncbi:MAG: flavin reductase [Clostridiales bacterium]|nr:flavin reductase [Clostridiales bacterium]
MANPMNNISYGLFVVTTKNQAKHNGCITNTVMQVTTTPNVITLAVNKQNYTHDLIMESKIFNVSIISEKANFELFKHFGFQSGRDVDKFDGFTDCKLASNGLYYITKGVNTVISAKVIKTEDLGTHTLFIAEVTDSFIIDEAPSATYAYYFANIKPKPQAKVTKTLWRCNICGYEEEVEELPDDFECPLCKHPKSDFTKITV